MPEAMDWIHFFFFFLTNICVNYMWVLFIDVYFRLFLQLQLKK